LVSEESSLSARIQAGFTQGFDENGKYAVSPLIRRDDG